MKELKAINFVTMFTTIVISVTLFLVIFACTKGYFAGEVKTTSDVTIFYTTIVFIVLSAFFLLVDWFLLVFEIMTSTNNSLFKYPKFYGLAFLLSPFIIGLVLQVILTWKMEKEISSKTKLEL